MVRRLLILFPFLFSLLGAVIGPQSAQVVMVKFADTTTEPCTSSYMADLVFNKFNNWIQTESHGLASFPGDIDNVWGWYILPHDRAYYCTICGSPPSLCSCDPYLISNDIKTLAAPHFVWDDQTIVVMVLNLDPPGVLAVNGGPLMSCHPDSGLPVGWFDFAALAHEGGHVYGPFAHANQIYCADGRDIGLYYDFGSRTNDGCTWVNYGNPFDPMGPSQNYDPVARAKQHYSMPYQVMLGWKQPSNTQILTSSATVILTDMRLSTSAIQEVRIPLLDVPTPPFGFIGHYAYSLEYRPDVGVLINLNTDIPTSSIHEVNLVNGQALPTTITPSNPFIDTYRNITVGYVSSTPTTATIIVTLPGEGGGGGDPGCHGRRCGQRKRKP